MSSVAAPLAGGQRSAGGQRPWPVRWFPLLLAGSVVGLGALFLLHLMVGTVDVTPLQVITVLTGGQVDDLTHTVIWHLRLPRALVAVAAGAMLALAGAILQTLTRNPLADPDLTGATAGGVFLAVIWLSRTLVGWDVAPPGPELPLVALVGSMAAGTLVYLLSGAGRGDQIRFVLTGIMVATILRSATSVLLLRNQNANASILLWIIGSLNGRTWVHWDSLWPWAAVTIPLGLLAAAPANALQLGDGVAAGLGLRVTLSRAFLLFTAIALTAGAVSGVGALGFLGLIVPQIVRRLVGADARRLFPLSVVGGAGLLLGADIVARGLTQPAELPVGALMALLGAPFLIYLLRRREKRG